MSGVLRKLKAILEEEISTSSNVFIIGHNVPDFDSLGSAMGLSTLATSLGKKSYIIVNDVDKKMQKLIDDYKEQYNFITVEEFKELYNDNSILIMSDVNKKNLIPLNDELSSLKSLIIIDHHKEDENTVPAKYKFIDTEVSSACEMVAQILNSFHVKMSTELASLLYAGIVLDTNRFKNNVEPKTHDVAEKLIKSGADREYVNSLFLIEYESYCRINNLVINNAIIKKYSDQLLPIQVSFIVNREKPKTIYRRDELARVSDTMMKFGFDASFTIGFVSDGVIAISARSGKNINVADIMSKIHGQGGGDACRAAGIVESTNIIEIEEEMMDIVADAIERLTLEKVATIPQEVPTISKDGLLLEIEKTPDDDTNESINPTIAVQRVKSMRSQN